MSRLTKREFLRSIVKYDNLSCYDEGSLFISWMDCFFVTTDYFTVSIAS